MEYIKPISFNTIKPITFIKPILDENGNIVRNSCITDNCELYDIDEIKSHNFLDECKKSDIKVSADSMEDYMLILMMTLLIQIEGSI